MTSPLVTVLLPVKNGGAFLERALSSLKNQTFTDFFVWILDNGSDDTTESVSKKFAALDRRFEYHNLGAIGRSAALNFGLTESKSTFIARMDADDVCFSERFEKQVAYLMKNPRVAVCSASVFIVKGSEVKNISRCPQSDAHAKAWLISTAPFSHSCVMLRGEELRSHGLCYDKEFRVAEDYDLWERCAHNGLKFGFVSEPLLEYYLHENQDTSRLNLKQREEERLIWLRILSDRFKIPCTEGLLDCHEATFRLKVSNEQQLQQSGAWLEKLWEINRQIKTFPLLAFSDVCGEIWWKLLSSADCNFSEKIFCYLRKKFIYQGATNIRRLAQIARMKIGSFLR